MGADVIAYLVAWSLLGLTVVAFLVGFVGTYIVHTGDPDPKRLSVRLALVVAALVDNATWPARSGAAR